MRLRIGNHAAPKSAPMARGRSDASARDSANSPERAWYLATHSAYSRSLGEHTYPGVIGRILTNPIAGFDHYQDMMQQLEDKEALKVYVNVAE